MLKIKNLTVSYLDEKKILKEISFNANKGEVICLMGESGSGKSTLLKSIYGLLELEQGSIKWNNTKVTGPEDNLILGYDKFKYVPQDFELMPYISVEENIGKYLSRFNMKNRDDQIDKLLDTVELSNYKKTKIHQLSGGQQQRVAIARALATLPELILLDEPFGQIDNFKKNRLRRNLFSSLKAQNIPCIIATHDVQDALSFADRLIILKNGEIIEDVSPLKFYNNPTSIYAASLLDDVSQITINNKTFLAYPNHLKIVKKSEFTATVLQSYFKGSHWLIKCLHENKLIFINNHKSIQENTEICFKFKI